MPYIPHTKSDWRAMLDALGVDSVDTLFDELPPELDWHPDDLPAGLKERDVARLMQARAGRDQLPTCFLGAGAYDHYVPAPVWEIATRGEFYSAYTPYQAEASQGLLQLIYEYQSMMAELTALDVVNASLYDGASALAEAVLMAVRCQGSQRGRDRVLIPDTVHPNYRRVVQTLTEPQGIRLDAAPFDARSGQTGLDALDSLGGDDLAAVVIPQPNFFGVLEDVDALTDWAHDQGALAVAVVNPLALAWLQPPGEWGSEGADIACGEGQPLGVPLSAGGPYFGILCSRQKYLRQMPGRLVGRTVDSDGRTGYVLTLQTREQHIRRSRATSNICTNQGLLVTAATIHMALMGAGGLAEVAATCHANTQALVERLSRVPGVQRCFDGPVFHEAVITLDQPAAAVCRRLLDDGLLAGYPLGDDYPDLGNALLVCATEQRTPDEMDLYAERLAVALR